VKNVWKELFPYPPQTAAQRLLWEIAFLLIITVAIGFLGRPAAEDVLYTKILTAVFLLNLALRFALVNQKGDWLFYLLGVVAGGGNDLMSMIKGVYSYTSIDFIPFLTDLLPLWMILFWGQVFLLFRKVFNLSWFRGKAFTRDGRFLHGWLDGRLIIDLLILVALRLIIYNTYALEPWIAAAFYATIIGIRFAVFPLQKNELALIAILPYAFMFEGLLITFGLYVYIHPIFLGMPLWLFLWWIFLVPTILKAVFDRLEYVLSAGHRMSGGDTAPAERQLPG